MRIVRTVAEVRAAVAQAPGPGRARPDHGRAARRATSRSSRARARADARSSSSRSSSTPRSSTSRATSPPTRATRSATPPGRPRPAPTSCSPRRSTRSTPPGSPRRSASAGVDRARSRATHRGAGHFDGRRDRRHQALQHGRAGRRVLRPEGRPAARRHPPPRPRPRHARSAIEAVADRARARRPGALEPQRPPRRAPTASARSRSAARSQAAEARDRRRRARRRRAIRAAALAAMHDFGVEPEYLALVSPETFEPVDDGRRPRARRRRRAGRRDTTHRQHADRAQNRGPGGRDMTRTMLKSKIHRATVTDCDLHYVGSITIDPDLLEAADILEHEQVHVVDVDNGARFETYTIAGERGSGEMKVNGAAARLVHRGDTIIVISYAQYTREEMEHYEPRVVHVDARQPDHRGGRPGRDAAHRKGARTMSTLPTDPHPERRVAPADDAAAAGREEGPRRADRDGHRVRLPERARGRRRRRRPRPRRRLGRDDRARLPLARSRSSSTSCSCSPRPSAAG